jgi:hypothetical protein
LGICSRVIIPWREFLGVGTSLGLGGLLRVRITIEAGLQHSLGQLLPPPLSGGVVPCGCLLGLA